MKGGRDPAFLFSCIIMASKDPAHGILFVCRFKKDAARGFLNRFDGFKNSSAGSPGSQRDIFDLDSGSLNPARPSLNPRGRFLDPSDGFLISRRMPSAGSERVAFPGTAMKTPLVGRWVGVALSGRRPAATGRGAPRSERIHPPRSHLRLLCVSSRSRGLARPWWRARARATWWSWATA